MLLTFANKYDIPSGLYSKFHYLHEIPHKLWCKLLMESALL